MTSNAAAIREKLRPSDPLNEPPIAGDLLRLDNWQAFVVLFAISFGPAFIAVDLTTESDTNELVTGILVFLIVLVFLSNLVSVWMLTQIHSFTKLGSYQEVAYTISKGNRGYIFLISVMKSVYLIITSAYCFQFIANYLTVLTMHLANYTFDP